MIRRMEPIRKVEDYHPIRLIEPGWVECEGWQCAFSNRRESNAIALCPPDEESATLRPGDLVSRAAIRKAFLVQLAYFVDDEQMDLLWGHRRGGRWYAGVLQGMVDALREEGEE